MRLLEVIVGSVEDALEAERGGAGRLEVCRDLEREGLSPPFDVVREIVRRVSIPVRVMLRERPSLDAGDEAELRRMCDDARACEGVGAAGLVIGFTRDGRIEFAPLERLLGAAPSCRVTVHRAFEATADPLASLDALKHYPQIDRVLAGGQGPDWPSRLATLQVYARQGAPQIGVLPGGGIDLDVLPDVAGAGFDEAHVGRAARESASANGRVVASKVAALVEAFTRHG